jgi:hypothetical protein
MREQEVAIGAFIATHQDGKVCVIDVLPIKSGYELETEHGQPVTRIRRGQYRITGTYIELTSDDPEAL